MLYEYEKVHCHCTDIGRANSTDQKRESDPGPQVALKKITIYLSLILNGIFVSFVVIAKLSSINCRQCTEL